MDEDDRELLRRLFVAATALSETAQEAAVTGQSSALAARDYADAARRLLAAARGLAALAEAAAVIAEPAGEGARTGRIHLGCRLESDFFTPFVKDGKITVVLDQEVANFRLAHEVEYRINEEFRLDSYDNSRVPAKAIDQKNIEVFIPPQNINHPAEFVAQIEDLILDYVPRVARVYIDQESGLVVIGGDVEIRPVAFTHKDIVVETGNPSEDRFIGLDTFDREATKLRSLVEALNAIKVPSTDVIEIIRGLKRQGSLLGKVIVE
ncbi:MAG: flagellar basal body P-ring protein FlgI [Proteobacteria bacterium]|nr:flagellar basal body P-ring protein FlgI [Pseudomonadota bacterium]